MNKKVLFVISVLLLLVTGVVGAALNLAHAQNRNTTNLNLTVSPPVFDLTANPGDKVTQSFRIRNNEANPIPLEITARRLKSDPNNGSPVPDSTTEGEELSWISFEPSKFTAPAREWTDVKFTIDIPESAAFGYYFVFSIKPTNVTKQEQTGTAVQGELLVVTLLNVKKEGAVSAAKLLGFKTDNFVSQYLPIKFNVELQNTGNVHVKPHGNIFITRDGKKDITLLDVNAANGSILPNGKRTFEALWEDGFLVYKPVMEDGQPKLDKNGRPEQKLTVNWNKLTSFRIGPYYARLLMVYDDGKRDQVIEAETKFWVVPYTAIAIMVAGIIIFFMILRFILRRYIASQIRKQSK